MRECPASMRSAGQPQLRRPFRCRSLRGCRNGGTPCQPRRVPAGAIARRRRRRLARPARLGYTGLTGWEVVLRFARPAPMRRATTTLTAPTCRAVFPSGRDAPVKAITCVHRSTACRRSPRPATSGAATRAGRAEHQLAVEHDAVGAPFIAVHVLHSHRPRPVAPKAVS
jgi:hypothetical protein